MLITSAAKGQKENDITTETYHTPAFAYQATYESPALWMLINIQA
jgi:hypothetical protein